MLSFRYKTILGIAAIEAVLLAILLSNILSYMNISNEQQLKNRAETTATLFVTTTADAVISNDLASLESFVDELMKNRGLMYARVLNDEGEVLAERSKIDLSKHNLIADTDIKSVDDSIYDATASIELDEMHFGDVQIGLDIQSLQKLQAEALRHGMTLAAIEMGLVALFSFILGYYLTRQLSELTRAARLISRGKLGFQIPVRGQDELGQTAEAFNQMSLELKKDIDELKANREALSQSEQHLNNVLTVSGEGIWDWDLRTNKVTHNQRWCDILQIDDSFLEHDVDFFVDKLHPEDRDMVVTRIENAILEKTDYVSEHRLLLEEGEVWVHDRGRVVEYAENGDAVRMSGSIRDITEKKGIAARLENMHTGFDKLCESSPLPCVIFDAEKNLLANKAYNMLFDQKDNGNNVADEDGWHFEISRKSMIDRIVQQDQEVSIETRLLIDSEQSQDVCCAVTTINYRESPAYLAWVTVGVHKGLVSPD
jgi:PAS domain S-box-containing protein